MGRAHRKSPQQPTGQRFFSKHRTLLLGSAVGALVLGSVAALLTQTAVRLTLWTLLGQTTTVQTIQQASDAVGTTVILEGKVSDRVPLVDAQVIQLQDSTGSLWIVTPDTTIPTGVTLRIRGKIRFESMPLEGREAGEVYVEGEG